MGAALSLDEPGGREGWEQLCRHTSALQQLSKAWVSGEAAPLWWDRWRGCLATRRSRTTYRDLFGLAWRRWVYDGYLLGRRMRQRERVRRWVGPLPSSISLPSDAVVFPRLARPMTSRDLLVVASSCERKVLKLAYGEVIGSLEREREALQLARDAGIGHHVPKVMEGGQLEDGGSWLLMQLAVNTHPFRRRVRFNSRADLHRRWLCWLQDELLPIMQRFYERSGPQVLGGEEYLEVLSRRIARHPTPEPLRLLAEMAEEARRESSDDRLVVATVHGDLAPGHMHREAKDWTLIDFGGTRRSPVVCDVLGCFLHEDSDAHPGFWAWLRGGSPLGAVPREALAYLHLYSRWQKTWMGICPDESALRFHILAALLERLARGPCPPRFRYSANCYHGLGLSVGERIGRDWVM